MESYRRLTLNDRYQIKALLESGRSVRAISRQMKRSASTICRELRSGRDETDSYCAEVAQSASEQKRTAPHFDQRKIRGKLEAQIRRGILRDWSPEQIGGRLKFLEIEDRVSYSTTYRFLERDKAQGGRLWKHLRILRKKRKDRKVAHWHVKQHMPDRVMISERPPIVEARKRLGDYERDCVLGKRNGAALLTMVDRTSRLLKLALLPKKTSEIVHRATIKCLRSEIVKTITNDSGTEFARHSQTAKTLRAPIFFANPYRSWERGTNENLNGLLRQYFPKKRNIGVLTRREIKRIEYLINSRPRKCLGFKTPLEIHSELSRRVLR